MAPIDNLPLNILARILQFGSALPYGGPPREDYYDRAPYEVVRADFLRQTSLVNKTFRKQAQLLLFSRPFFRSVADFSTFRVVVQQYGRANQVRGVVFILESGKSAHLKWKRVCGLYRCRLPFVSNDWSPLVTRLLSNYCKIFLP